MLIKVESDVFDIEKRIKEIDDGYFVVFNTKRNKYEIHNMYQENSYCLTIPFDNLDNRILDLINMSLVRNIDKIIDEIDNNNSKLENKSLETIKDYNDYLVREIYAFSNNSSKEYELEKAFSSIWR